MPFSRRAVCLGLAAATAEAGVGRAGEACDLIIAGAEVVDGAGSPRRRADVAVTDGRIVALGDLRGVAAKRRIDAPGRVVTPGFIDLLGQDAFRYASDPDTAECRLRQGVTTHFAGEGWSHAPETDPPSRPREIAPGRPARWRTLEGFNAIMQAAGTPLNIIHNVGAGQVRLVAMGAEARPPSAAELRHMRRLVAEAMRQGASGVSSGLIYPPGSYARTDELIALARTAGRFGGGYYTHVRNESARLIEAVEEALLVGREARVPVHIFHLKAAGRENWPLIDQAVGRINAARRDGQAVTSDLYPYLHNGLDLRSLVDPDSRRDPAWISRLGQPDVQLSIRRSMDGDGAWENWYRHAGRDWRRVIITGTGEDPRRDLAGLTITEAAARAGVDPWTLFFQLLAVPDILVALETMNEAQKRLVFQQPWTAVATDSLAVDPRTDAASHPRAFGSFPRVLATWVRDQHLLTLEEAVRRMTSLAAGVVGLRDRGTIAVGMAADLVVFDPERITDRATFAEPTLFSEGVEYVTVNGALAIDAGAATGARPGLLLKRNQRGAARLRPHHDATLQTP